MILFEAPVQRNFFRDYIGVDLAQLLRQGLVNLSGF
jgi:hypothetical protein